MCQRARGRETVPKSPVRSQEGELADVKDGGEEGEARKDEHVHRQHELQEVIANIVP